MIPERFPRAGALLFAALSLPLVAVAILAVGFAPALAAALYLAVVSPWLIRTDLREHRLPNRLVLPGIAIGLLSCADGWWESGRMPVVPLVAAGAYAGFLFLFSLLGGMGMGDVKLAAALGLASWNPDVAVLSPVLAFFVGGLVSVVLLLGGRRGRRIAFGPFLLGGYFVAASLVALSLVGAV